MMRFFFLLLFTILTAHLVPAQQPRCDLKFELSHSLPDHFYLDSGDFTPDIYLRITNLGPDALDTTDYIYYGYNSATPAIDTGTQGKKYLEPGDSMIIFWGSIGAGYNPVSSITRQLCYNLIFSDSTHHWFEDPDTYNNEMCIYYTIQHKPSPNNIATLQTSYFKISPNPATDYVRVQFHNNDFMPVTLSIYDIQGRKLYTTAVSAGQADTAIAISSFPRGIYLLKIRDNKEVIYTEKFLKD